MTKPPLTKRKAGWAANRDVTLRGTPLAYNAAQQSRYVKALEAAVKLMVDTTKKEIVKMFHEEPTKEFFKDQKMQASMDDNVGSKARILMNKLLDRFSKLFAMVGKRSAEQMVNGSEKTSASTLHSSLKQLSGGLSLKTSAVPEGMEDVTTASIAENVSLIKSIPQEYFKNITGAVMRSITSGTGLATLTPEIVKYSGQTKRRARNIALDQTRKAYNSINKQRMQALGVKQFIWVHSNAGQTPRESHLKIDGEVFDFENLDAQQAALGVPEKDRGIPGHAINCRCTMMPVIKFED